MTVRTDETNGEAVTISIVVKALNEERRIAACIESALAGLGALSGEVILADSGSTDDTIRIAARYPIRIVRLADTAQRRCGIGAQLGFQFARGEYLYVLDGDMELDPRFLVEAVRALEDDPGLAGVAGLVEEVSADNVQFRGRKSRALEGRPGEVRWLDMGGLYRSSALKGAGYLSNRNLHACEEQELGLRLTAAGWRMKRLAIRSVRHYGHTDGTFSLQRKRLRSGYLLGPGEVLRASIGRPYFWSVARIHRHLIATLALCALLMLGLVLLPVTAAGVAAWLAALVALLAERTLRYGSPREAIAIIAIWHINAVELVRGFLRPQIDPATPIPAVVVADSDAAPLAVACGDRRHAR